MLGTCFDKLVESHSSSVESSDAVSSGQKKKKKKQRPHKATSATASKASQSRYWSPGESKDFEVALKLFKTDYRAISKYVGTRTPSQVRSHAKKFYQKLIRDYKKRSSDNKEGKRAPQKKKREEEGEKRTEDFPASSWGCTCHRSHNESAALALESPTSTLLSFEDSNPPCAAPAWTIPDLAPEHVGGSYGCIFNSPENEEGDNNFLYGLHRSTFSIPEAAAEAEAPGSGALASSHHVILPPLMDQGDSMESLFGFFFEDDAW